MHNKNSGYGRLVAERLSRDVAGKVFIVGKAAVAYRDMYAEIFDNDTQGVARVFSTVDAAIGACTANAGDTIYVLPGHTETVTATSIALDVAGVNIICLGSGSNRPTFTFGAAAATITVTGANSTWKGGLLVANFADVAAAFTVGAAVNFRVDGVEFRDTSSILNFLSALVTGATNNEADGLTFVNNYVYGLAATANAVVSILANENYITIADNFADKAATNDAGQFITLSSKVILGARIARNRLILVGATGATVGIFLTGSATTCTGIVENNYVASLDTTTELIATAGTKLKYFENYYTGTADVSGKLWPVVDAA